MLLETSKRQEKIQLGHIEMWRLNEPIAFCYILNRSFVKAKFEAIVHILLPSVFEKLILNSLSIPCFKKSHFRDTWRMEKSTILLLCLDYRGDQLSLCDCPHTITLYGHSVQFSHSVISDSLRPHGLQYARLPCPSSTPWACLKSLA